MKRVAIFSIAVWALCAAPALGSGISDPERQFSQAAGAETLRAQEFMNREDYSQAVAMLEQALALPELSPYEQSVMYQMLGSSHYELGDYASAISDFEQAMNAGGLLPKEAANLRLNIAQLLIANEQFAKGAQMLEDWQQAGGIFKHKQEEMLWQAWVQAENYERALPWAEQWAGETGHKQRQHYDVLNFLYAQLGMDAKQTKIVEQMIGRWPEDKTLWRALGSLLVKTGRETDAFEVEKILYIRGALTGQDELQRLVQYYAYYGMPYQAARILEKELNTGRIVKSKAALTQLADLLRQAREFEKAIPVLKLAAMDSGEGADYAKLAEAYYHRNKCGDADLAAQKAAQLNYRQSGKLFEQVGVCYYEAAQDTKRASCFKPDEKTARKGLQEKALGAFNSAQKSGRASQHIVNWKSLILAAQKRDEERCMIIDDIREQRCMIEIRHAYSSQIFTPALVLNDQTCSEFLPEYDRLYKRK